VSFVTDSNALEGGVSSSEETRLEWVIIETAFRKNTSGTILDGKLTGSFVVFIQIHPVKRPPIHVVCKMRLLSAVQGFASIFHTGRL